VQTTDGNSPHGGGAAQPVSLRAQVDEDSCISSGRCVAEAPGRFEFSEEQIAHAVDGAQELGEAALLMIARACPAGAIMLFKGGEPVDIF
jgi:ferredoxin